MSKKEMIRSGDSLSKEENKLKFSKKLDKKLTSKWHHIHCFQAIYGYFPSRHFEVRMTTYKNFIVDFGIRIQSYSIGIRLNLKNFIFIYCVALELLRKISHGTESAPQGADRVKVIYFIDNIYIYIYVR